ncbi:MAG TPA: DUF983 domain-containing protein [Ferrovibrio sp.]|jgi:uncharacterized protein (DUF983 family)|uniref:DUF983 domain-containing protein n=1 Tax=Ferrovibrio sp. TaxID=1917215 RepID=UPI002ED36BFA
MPLLMGELIERPAGAAMLRGWRRRCPQCGEGGIFAGYLAVNPQCPSCGLALSGHRADDAPPYFTILIVGHIIVPLMLLLEQHLHPAEWVHMALWLPLTLLLSLWLLPHIKGSLIGLQWAKRMHGFGPDPD